MDSVSILVVVYTYQVLLVKVTNMIADTSRVKAALALEGVALTHSSTVTSDSVPLKLYRHHSCFSAPGPIHSSLTQRSGRTYCLLKERVNKK